MKQFLISTLFLLFSLTAYAQKGSLTLKVVDAENQEGIAGAVIAVTPVRTPDKPQYITSGYQGKTTLSSLPYGEYTLKITFLGYNDHNATFRIKGTRLDLGSIALKQGVNIETVVKEVKALRTSQKGDTVSYNAGAFKVASDADVEGLLKKMPGITVTNGAVEAQGEQVQRILVDGKEFFGDDVTTAIKTLPAEAVDRIEVYNKLSDAAEFSGMDDGEGVKAINIVTHKSMRKGQFGKVYAGFGYDADTRTEDRFKYIAGGNVNIFNDESRLSVIALFNNVNRQNFSFEDILGVSGSPQGGPHRGMGAYQYMVRPQSGVASVNAIGVNYSDTWGKKKKWAVEGSYFFNNTDTRNHARVEKWYEAPMYHTDTLQTVEDSDTEGFNHRLNARLRWNISENQNLMIRPMFSYQSNDPLSRTLGWQFGAPEEGGSGYSRTDQYKDRDMHGYTAGMNLVYRLKLGKTGRTLTLDGYGRYTDNTDRTNSWSNSLGRQPVRPSIDPETGAWDPDQGYIHPGTGEVRPYVKLRYLHNDSPQTKYNLRSQVTYTEPLGKHLQMSLQYRLSHDNEERNKTSFITPEDFSIQGLSPDPNLSNSYRSNYTRHSVGPGLRYTRERNTLIATVYYQNSTLKGESVNARYAGDPTIRKSFSNVTYFLMGRMNINQANSLRLFISSYTSKPSVANLQDIYDVSNAQHIKHGNPDLNPQYTHSIRFHYTNSNSEKGRTFMWSLYFQTTQDYNTPHMIQTPGKITIDGKTYTPNFYSRQINLDGYRRLRTQLSYGFPIGFLKSNFNIMAGVNYTSTPNLLGGELQADGTITGGERNDTHNMGYDTRAVLGSNISEKVDFTLSWDGTYNEATNNYNGERIKNRYFNHTAQANMKFVFPLNFTFTGSLAYTQYLGFTNNYDDSYLLCNLWIGKKIFRNQRGEILVGINDVFNQNKSFARTTGSGWTQNTLNSVVGRYYMIQFNYNLRRFGKNGSRNMKDYGMGGGSRPHPHGRPQHPHAYGMF